MRTTILIVALLALAWSPAHATTLSDCSSDVLPDGPKNCVYRHVAYDSFEYTAGRLEIRWPKHFEMQEVYVARDWKKAFPYQPGSQVRLALAPDSRYDVVARFTDRSSGETFLGLTPIACRSRLGALGGVTLIPAPVEGCVDVPTSGCRVRSETDCTDEDGNPSGTVSVECSGDRGTCSDSCGDSESACCEATTTSTETSSDGTQTSVTSVEQQEQGCP